MDVRTGNNFSNTNNGQSQFIQMLQEQFEIKDGIG